MPSTLMPATSSYDAAVFLRQFSGLIFAKLAPAVSRHVSSAAKEHGSLLACTHAQLATKPLGHLQAVAAIPGVIA